MAISWHFVKRYLGRDRLSSFRNTGVQAYDHATKFRLSTLLSATHRIAGQLQFQSCDVIGWRKCRFSEFRRIVVRSHVGFGLRFTYFKASKFLPQHVEQEIGGFQLLLLWAEFSGHLFLWLTIWAEFRSTFHRALMLWYAKKLYILRILKVS